MFLDRDLTSRRQFLEVTTKSARLHITPQHLVVRQTDSGPEEVFAARLKRGDRLMVTSDGQLIEERVRNVTLTLDRGVVAPLTRTGTLVVDGVLASCYAVIESQGFAHAAFGPLRLYVSAKEALTVIYEMAFPPVKKKASDPKLLQGIPWYPKFLYRISTYLVPENLLYDTSKAANQV